MKFIIALCKLLSFPLILAGGALIWYGAHNWTAGTADGQVNGSALFSKRPGSVHFRDSVRYDLSQASLRQDNFMGIKSPARAAFPVWTGSDTGAPRLIAVSSDPRFLGPVVQGFKRVDSVEGEIKVRSTSTASAGNLQPQFDALVQMLAIELKGHLQDSIHGRAILEGVALLQTDTARAGISPIASEYWEIRTEGVPSSNSVYLSLAGGVLAIGLGMALQIATGRRDRRLREEEEEERQNEKPMV
jgi:hypothetical protein